jgi:hypothetical protein
MRDTDDINPARGDVRRDENRDFSGLESMKRLCPLRLRASAVDPSHRHMFSMEKPGEPVGAGFGAGENERRSRPGLEGADQSGVLSLDCRFNDRLFDLGCGGLACGDLDLHGILQQVGRQPMHAIVPGRGKHHRLPGLRDIAHDLLELRSESHVEHPVGFIEHENFRPRERDRSGTQMVDEPAWRRDDHPGLLPECADLGLHCHAADQGHAAGVGRVAGELVPEFINLKCEFAGGSEHEGCRFRQPHQTDKNGNAKRRRLSGSSLGDPDQVSAREARRNGLNLNGSRRRKA